MAGEEAVKRLRRPLDTWFIGVFVCTVLGLPRASHTLRQGQARLRLGKLKTVGDILAVGFGAGRKPSKKALGAG